MNNFSGQEMKYRIEEGEISAESTEPKIIPCSSSSHDQSGNTIFVCLFVCLVLNDTSTLVGH